MKTITAIIEKSTDGGYSVYTKDVKGAIGYGLTEAEAREDFESVLEEQSEYFQERNGAEPDWAKAGYTIDYRYDFSGFFHAFPFINAAEFARSIGINPSLMRKYKNGLAFASEKQKMAIQSKFNEIVSNMASVQF